MNPILSGDTSSKGDEFSKKNREHFDKVATSDWPAWISVLHKQIQDFLESSEFHEWANLGSTNNHRRMLDYACGDGVISRILKPLFSFVLGVDVSAGMVEKYCTIAKNLGFSPNEMIGVRGDLISPNAPPTEPALQEKDLWNFDFVAISLALHHIEDPQNAITQLASRLSVGGKLLVIDWTPINGSTPAQRNYQEEVRQKNEEERIELALKSHAASHTVSKPNGFTYDEQDELFRAAGCDDVKWRLAEELIYIPAVDAKAQLYWAIATKSVN
ncbi:S-adenosyl-L-methionine-dependent methyltransferase [Lipomyces oligophaga]|uniref:S-adenosyl-L-methionine-dependent methyltransferase n=1 Tax=Lipomyces oligophaga TaxID=45792 RepID=UPI0034CF77A5